MEAACAALIAAHLSGIQLSQLDKSVIYEVPASAMARLSVAERTTARACALRLGIRYRTVKSQASMANTE
jgi:hypothetical protein